MTSKSAALTVAETEPVDLERIAPAAPSLELRPIASLTPYARNARTHSPEQISAIVRSIREFGWTNTILCDDQGIVAGHGRVVAAGVIYDGGGRIYFPNGAPIADGMVPCLDVSGWTPAQRRAYIIADNALAEQAGWDVDLLKLEVKELQADDFDLSLLGLGDQLTDLLDAGEPDRNPDDVPDVPKVAHSKEGDVWVLGAHRVMCGSSTEPLAWNTLMGREKADICWTDPPYNVAYESKLAGKIKNDSMSDGAFREFLRDFYTSLFAVMKDGGAVYVAHADTEGLNFRAAFAEAGFKLSGCLIWRKDSLVLGRSDFQWQHEPILYGWKPGSAHRWFGGRKQTTVQEWGEREPIQRDAEGRWLIAVGEQIFVIAPDAKVEMHPSSIHFEPKPKRSAEHPTMKPVGLIERHLKNNARTGDLVVDGFGGSGSTLIAADRLGMVARLMELDPKFVDVIVRRWQDYTGRRAVHAQTGEEFPQ